MTKQYKEVAQLSSGSCFGEAALTNANSTRMATIKCLTDCYFGILSKESYEQTIALIQQSIIRKKVQFIMSCYQFQNESSHVLTEHHYLWKPIHFYQKQVVYKQGQPCNMVYLIKSGEFEQTIVVNKDNENELNSTTGYTGPTKQHKKITDYSSQINKKQPILIAHVALLNKGMMMGDEDTIAHINYSKSVVCKSISAETLAITSIDFLKLVKACHESHNQICKREVSRLSTQIN